MGYLTSEDIKFMKTDVRQASITFKVINRAAVQEFMRDEKIINHHRLKTVVCKTLAKRIICLKASTNIRKSGNYLLCGDVLDPRYKPVPLAHLSCQLLPHNILYPTYADPNNVFSNEQIPSVTFYYFFL